VFVADGDYVEKVKSEVRLSLTSAKAPTANQLQKRLDKQQRQLGKVKGTTAFNRSLGKDSSSDPQRSIEEALQTQFEWVWDLLAVENEDFDPKAKSTRPPAAQPKPLSGRRSGLHLGEGVPIRVQADGATAQEKWLASHKVLSARGKRKPVVLSGEMEARVIKTRVEVMEGHWQEIS
jgi:hypothetical protein